MAKKKKKNNKTLIIVEVTVIIAAIAVIIVGVLKINGKKNTEAETVSADVTLSSDSITSSSAQTQSDETPAEAASEIDNSDMYDNMPAVPDAATINTLTEADAQQKADEGSMLRLDSSDGYYVYVPNYTNAEILSQALSYTDEELNDYMVENFLLDYTATPSEDRTVCQKYDTVNIDYEGFMDGVAFDGGTAEGASVTLGSGAMIPGFEEGIIGMSVGETKDIYVTFPEDYYEDMAGKDATFTITLNSITAEPAELTDELVQQQFSDITTVDECVEYYRTEFLSSKVYDFLTTDYFINAVPSDKVSQYYKTSIDYYAQLCAYYYSTSISATLEASGSSADELKSELVSSASYSAVYTKMVNIIAENAGITVTDEDVAELAEVYSYTDLAEFKELYGEDNINDVILDDKVNEYIISLVQ